MSTCTLPEHLHAAYNWTDSAGEIDELRTRNARPEHFHRSVAHGLAVVAAGAHPNLLGVLSRGAMARGLADASEGYTHARLRLMAAGVDGR